MPNGGGPYLGVARRSREIVMMVDDKRTVRMVFLMRVSLANERPRVSAPAHPPQVDFEAFAQVDLTPQRGFSPLRGKSHQLKSTFSRLRAG